MTGQILIVDDDAAIREPMAVILSAVGYSVTEAVDGLDAIEKVRIGFCKPTAVLLDIEMPRLDGRGFLRELEAASLPVITAREVILVSAAPDVAKIAAEFRVPSYFTKPFVVEQLLKAIGRLHGRPL